MKIFKYRIPGLGKQILDLPMGAKILSAGIDLQEVLCIWALVDPYSPTVEVDIETVYTGQEPETCHKFLGTVVANLVYHVFTK